MKALNSSKKLSDVCQGRDNNLNIIRFIAAILVIYCHSFPFTYGQGHGDWLADFTRGQINLGGIAVSVFFFYGGFLICKSLDRLQNGKKFFVARIKRIFPPLIVVVIASAFIMGPILTTLSLKEYFTDIGTYKYLLNAILLPVHTLPGVFENNVYGAAVNGSLWTLPIEFLCYIFCYVFWKMGLMNDKKAKYTIPFGVIFLVIASLILSKYSPLLAESLRPAMLFYIGMLTYIYRDKLYLDGRIAIVLFVIFIVGMFTPFLNVFIYMTLPYILLYIGYGMKYKLSNFGKNMEISYGMYLCGAPIQQMLVLFFGTGMSQIANAFVASIIAMIAGVILCITVEKPIQKINRI